jgi:hypothetical protein
MKTLKYVSLLFLFLIGIQLRSQSVLNYTVDKDYISPAVPGTITYILNQIQNNAISANTVNIEFDAPTGLVKVNQLISFDMSLNTNVVKITMKPKRDNGVSQGFDFSNVPAMFIQAFPSFNFFSILSNSNCYNTSATLQEINLQSLNFEYNTQFLYNQIRSASYFSSCVEKLYINNIKTYEKFLEDDLKILSISARSGISLVSDFKMTNSLIKTYYGIKTDQIAYIVNNTFENSELNLDYFSYACTSTPPLVNNLTLQNNVFKVKNGVNIYSSEGKLYLSSSNILGFPLQNYGNTFFTLNKCGQLHSSSITYSTHVAYDIKIYGQSFNSSVGGNFYSQNCTPNYSQQLSAGDFEVRNSKITASLKDKPIYSPNSGNFDIKTFNVEGNQINYDISYNYASIINFQSALADISLDFYSSNSNGDIGELIGTFQMPKPTSLTGNFVGSCPLLKKINANKVHRVASTVTSYRDVTLLPCNSNSLIFGTSPAFYKYFAIDSCNTCLPSFALEVGKTYVVSGWAKEEGASATATNYGGNIQIKFDNLPTNTVFNFPPSGPFVEGWQRIEGEFTVPLTGAANMEINLQSSAANAVYFDDVRVHPYDGTMNSYVYNPNTLRLEAVLDERNHATIYEYDEEGKLVRVKKETERGIMTIKESRYNAVKKPQ